ncbi:fructose-bisphosphate aldolase [Cypionkella aquatica]|uniref:Fructose-bisphosphate aldolase n=1 Tax=Cypionkella aquatica TaxID=1756042 RepID=A0AA37U140_9RHOB|nr:class II fructose-bisphosphate aldolase [Cypionkella aquatica]GLS86776.1 fructose-bisphosphate aldolase [Cypionkella aquatica]
MSIATLSQVLRPCLSDGTAVAGLVVLGWEDARAYVAAAEAARRPVILQAGPGCRAHTPLPVLAAMFRTLAETAQVPVVAHLDHGADLEICRQAIDCGFTSVMYDGSALPLQHNIDQTAEVVALAHRHGVSVEAELGYVGYDKGAASQATDPAEAARFAAETRVDALAVSVGNTHLMSAPDSHINATVLRAIMDAAPDLPLVIHGGSGIPASQRLLLAQQTSICKFNIGTELRMAFGAALRATLAENPQTFDRIAILSATMPALQIAAHRVIAGLSQPKP